MKMALRREKQVRHTTAGREKPLKTSVQVAGDRCGKFLWPSWQCVATGGSDRNKRKNYYHFARRRDGESFRRANRFVWHHRLSHTARRLSCTEHDARISGAARVSCRDSRRRRKVCG